MVHNKNALLEYWNKENVESMYDKFLLGKEIDLIVNNIPANTKILDAGCGEGEGTLKYSKILGTSIHAADFSTTRLKKAKKRLSHVKSVKFIKIDFLGEYDLDYDYDVIITQRFLINLKEWELQKKVIKDLISRLKRNGLLLLLEGSKNGVEELNQFRKIFDLPVIPVKWHNLFFSDCDLEKYLEDMGMKLLKKDGLGEYFLLTRGIRPIFDNKVNWNSKFNKISASDELKSMISFGHKFSRLKLWVTQKI